MRAVVQRVSRAEVRVAGEVVGRIGCGLLVLLGVERDDGDQDVDYLARKVVGLRVFEDEQQAMNRSLQQVGGALLVVSQFTLLGDCRKGRRPSFIGAMEPEGAEQLCRQFVAACQQQGVEVQTGRFRTAMEVKLCNDGPVTLIIDSRKRF